MDWLIGKQSSETDGYSELPLPSCAPSPLTDFSLLHLNQLYLEAFRMLQLLFAAK